MGILDDLISVDSEGNFLNNQWIEWDHFLVPNKPEWLRTILRNLISILAHCMSCTSLDGCYFVERNMPKAAKPL